MIVIAVLLSAVNAYADSRQQSLMEWLGLISYEPKQDFFKNFAELEKYDLGDGPLLPFVPETARNIHVFSSVYFDQVVAEYSFDKLDLEFFTDKWTELNESEIRQVLSIMTSCPWQRPIPGTAKFFQSPERERWGISGYAAIDTETFAVWYYWSSPRPAAGSFCP
ncbi:MAG: hypothetical protein KA176_04615 [Alphaproteobacteria bacterium]|nr:hypothetical protein [Alphaproteobacteria bacterium]